MRNLQGSTDAALDQSMGRKAARLAAKPHVVGSIALDERLRGAGGGQVFEGGINDVPFGPDWCRVVGFMVTDPASQPPFTFYQVAFDATMEDVPLVVITMDGANRLEIPTGGPLQATVFQTTSGERPPAQPLLMSIENSRGERAEFAIHYPDIGPAESLPEFLPIRIEEVWQDGNGQILLHSDDSTQGPVKWRLRHIGPSLELPLGEPAVFPQSLTLADVGNNAGGFNVNMVDGNARFGFVQSYTIVGPGGVLAFPWDAMTTHAQIDDWADANGVARGADWGQMTLASKRQWLVAYFDGARPWEAGN
jgi:hypothetical protein